MGVEGQANGNNCKWLKYKLVKHFSMTKSKKKTLFLVSVLTIVCDFFSLGIWELKVPLLRPCLHFAWCDKFSIILIMLHYLTLILFKANNNEDTKWIW